MSGEFLGDKFSAITDTKGGVTLELSDTINICQYNCDCNFGINASFSVSAINPSVSLTLTESLPLPPRNLSQN